MLYKLSQKEALKLGIPVLEYSMFNMDIKLKDYLNKFTLDSFTLNENIRNKFNNYLNFKLNSIPKEDLYKIIEIIINTQTSVNTLFIDKELLDNLKLRDDLLILTEDQSSLLDLKLFSLIKNKKKKYFNYKTLALSFVMFLYALIFLSLFIVKPSNNVRNDFINHHFENPITLDKEVEFQNDLSSVVKFEKAFPMPYVTNGPYDIYVTDYMKTYDDETFVGDPTIIKLKDNVVYGDKRSVSYLDRIITDKFLYDHYDVFNPKGDKLDNWSIHAPKLEFKTEPINYTSTLMRKNFFMNKNTFKSFSDVLINRMTVKLDNKDVEIVCVDDLLLEVFKLYDEKKLIFKDKNHNIGKPLLYDEYKVPSAPGTLAYGVPDKNDVKNYILTNDESLSLNSHNLISTDYKSSNLEVKDYGYIDIYVSSNDLPQIFVEQNLYTELYNKINYQDKYLNENIDAYFIKPNSKIENYIDDIRSKATTSVSDEALYSFNEKLNEAKTLESTVLTLFIILLIGFITVEVVDNTNIYKKKVLFKDYNIVTFKYHYILKFLLLFFIITMFMILI